MRTTSAGGRIGGLFLPGLICTAGLIAAGWAAAQTPEPSPSPSNTVENKTPEQLQRELEEWQRDPSKLDEQAARNRALWETRRRGEAGSDQSASPDAAEAQPPQPAPTERRRSRNVREYYEARNREAREAATRPAGAAPVAETEAPPAPPAEPKVEGEAAPPPAPPAEPRVEGEAPRTADQLPQVSDEEVEKLIEAAKREAADIEARQATGADANAGVPAGQPAPAAPPTTDHPPPGAHVTGHPMTQPAQVPAVPQEVTHSPPAQPNGMAQTTTQPAPQANGVQPPSAAPPGTAQAPKEFPRDANNQPDIKKAQPDWFKIPPEERPYFFVWKTTPMQKVLDDIGSATGLTWLGLTQITQIDAAFLTKQLTFESDRIMTFDEALSTINELFVDFDYWICRRPSYLEIRKLTEWYRRIAVERMFPSVDAYRDAKLPKWELVSVLYQPKERSAQALAEGCVDLVPLNAARAAVVSETGQIELSGFSLFIDRQLAYLALKDHAHSDPRELKEYKLKNIPSGEAANLLRQLMPSSDAGTVGGVVGAPMAPVPPGMAAVPGRPGRPGQQPGQPGIPMPVGTAEADMIDITESSRRNVLLIWATPGKHVKIRQYLETYIDLPNEQGKAELIQLKYADPEKLAQVIRPLMGQQTILGVPVPQPGRQPNQPVPPPPQPGQPQPQQQLMNLGTSTVITPIKHIRSLLVKAEQDEMAAIKTYVEMLDVPQGKVKYEYVRLKFVEASGLAMLVNAAVGSQMTPDMGMGGMPRYDLMSSGMEIQSFKAIAAQHDNHGLMLIGEEKEIEEAKRFITTLDVDDAAGASQKLVRLKTATPTAMANMLSNRFSKGGGGGMGNIYGRYGLSASTSSSLPMFIGDDQSKVLLVLCHEEMWPAIENIIKEIDRDGTTLNTPKLYQLKYISSTAVVQILQQALAPMGNPRYYTDPSAPSFVADHQSNMVVVTADDEMQKRAGDLIGQLDQPGQNERKTVSLVLERADAQDAISTLKEIFMGVSSRGGRGGAADIPPVFTVPASGSKRILVTASESQIKDVRELLKELDGEDAVRKSGTYTLRLQYASAAELASTLTAVVGGGRGRGGYGYGMGGGGSDSPVIQAYDSNNTLVITCGPREYAEIEALVKTLDVPQEGGRSVKAYAVKHADVSTLVTAINGAFRTGGRYGYGGDAKDSVDATGDLTTSTIIVSASERNHLKIQELLKELDKEIESVMTTRTIKLQYALAQEVATSLNAVLRNRSMSMGGQGGRGAGPEINAYEATNSLVIMASNRDWPQIENLIKTLDIPKENERQVKVYPVRYAELNSVVAALSSSFGRGTVRGDPREDVDVTADMPTSSVVVTATEQNHAKITALLADLDKQNTERQVTTRSIRLEHASAQEAATSLTAAFRNQAGSRSMSGRQMGPDVQAYEATNSLLVTAANQDWPQVEALIKALDTPPENQRTTKVYAIQNADVTSVVTAVNGAFRTSYRNQDPRAAVDVTADSGTSSVVVTASEANHARIGEMLKELDKEGARGMTVRTVKLAHASAADLANTLSDVLIRRDGRRSGSQRTPEVEAYEATNSLVISALERDWPDIEGLIKTLDVPGDGQRVVRPYAIKNADPTAIVAALTSAFRAGRNISTRETVDATSDLATSSVIITASEQNHARIKELIAQLDQMVDEERVTLEPVQLTKADPEYVAQKLGELFESQTAGSSMYGARARKETTMKVVAEPVSNRVFISASKQDFEKAKAFALQLDEEYAGKEYERKTFVLKHADAAEVQQVIQTFFGDGGGDSGFGGYGGWMSRWYRSSSYGSSSNKPGSIKVVEAGGGLIIYAPKAKMAEIEKMITDLDAETAGKNEIRTYRIEGAESQGTMTLANTLDQMMNNQSQSRMGRAGYKPPDVKFMGSYGSNLLLVSAPAAKMEDIDKLVKQVMEVTKSADLTLVIRHFDIRNARAAAVAEMIQPILQSKYQEMAKGGGGGGGYYGGGYYGGGGRSGPQIIPHSSGNRIMVTAPNELMSLVAELIKEFDQPPTPSVMRVVELKKAKAEEIAPVIERLTNEGGGSSGGFYQSQRPYYSNVSYGAPSGSGATGSDQQLAVTPVPSSNSIILKGPDKKVYDAERMIQDLDGRTEPKGPMIKVFEIKYAGLFDVVDMIEELTGSGGGGGFMESRVSRGPDSVIVQPDFVGNRIIVSAPREKLPMVEQIIQLKESMAAPAPKGTEVATEAGPAGRGKVVTVGRGTVTKSYEVKGPTDEIAEQLDKILVALIGFRDSPWIKSFPFAKQIIVEGKPNQFSMVEEWLEKIEKDPPRPKMRLWVRPVEEGLSPQKVVQALQQGASEDMRRSMDIKEIPQAPGRVNPFRRIREVTLEDEEEEVTTQPAASPFVPSGTLRGIRAGLLSLMWLQGAAVETLPATQPSATTRPAMTVKVSTATQPAAGVAVEAATQPAVAAQPAAPAQPTAEKPAGAAKHKKEAAHTVHVTPPSPPPTVKNEKPAARQPAPAQASAPPATPAAEATSSDKAEQTKQTLIGAALEASGSAKAQIRYDEQQGLIYVVGTEAQVKEIQRVTDDIIDQLKKLTEKGQELPIRVFKVENIDVTIAAAILEQMFNDKAPQQAGQPRQPGAKKKPQAAAKQGDKEEESALAKKKQQEAEEGSEEGEQATQPVIAGGQRIRVVPDPRTRTLIIRASNEDFPLIAELLVKIDRKAPGNIVDIKIFQLKNLNATEVEDVIKDILKIEDPTRGRMRGNRGMMAGMGGMPGMAGMTGMGYANMIEAMQQEMLEMQNAQIQSAGQPGQEGQGKEGGVKINPTKDITLTSDLTTNSIIVSAPQEGMALVEKLINKLEELDIPLQIKSFHLNNADAEKVAEQLERLFRGGGGSGSSRRRSSGFGGFSGFGMDGVATQNRMGDIQISSDPRTNTVVIRALEPDMAKIEPVIVKLDANEEGGQVALYAIEHVSAQSVADTLTKMFATGQQTTSGSRAIQISAEAETNMVLVKAPLNWQKIIAAKIQEMEDRGKEKGLPKQIPLEFAPPTQVASKLRSIFGTPTKASRGKSKEVIIEGDDNSGTLFVTAPEELFKDIEKIAKQMDTASNQPTAVIKLKFAYAEDILPQLKAMIGQTMKSLGGGADACVVTADERTNSLIVTGSKGAHLAVNEILKSLDVAPDDKTTVTTGMFSLTAGNATSVASTINSLYAVYRPVGGVPKPYAVAEPVSNVVYVYGTKAQIDAIKLTVVDPMEAALVNTATGVKEFAIEIKNAKVEDAADTLTKYFSQRSANLRAAGTNMHPAELAVSIVADPVTKRLFVSSTEKNHKTIEELLKTIDAPDIGDAALQTRVFPVRFADLGYTVQAMNSVFVKQGRVSERDQVKISAEYGTGSIIVRANPENMKLVKEMLDQLDKGADTKALLETVRVENLKASELAKTLNDIIQRTMQRDKLKGQYPVAVSPNDAAGTVLLSATTQPYMDQMKTLIKQLDEPTKIADDRAVKPYPVKYVDLGTMAAIITSRFADNAAKSPREQVTVTPEYATGTVVVTASAENHEKVTTLIQELDRGDTGSSPTLETVKIVNVRAVDLAKTVDLVIQRTMKRDRITGLYPVSIQADDASNTLLVTASSKYMESMKNLIGQLDVKPDVTEERSVSAYPVKYADLGTMAAILTAQFPDNATRARKDQVSISAEYATGVLVITASTDNHKKMSELIEKLDKGETAATIETVRVKNVKATELAATLNQMIPQIYKRDRITGLFPVSVSANDAANSLLINAAPKNMEEIQALIARLDQRPDPQDERSIKPYMIKHADLSSMNAIITAAFPNNQARSPRDQVSVSIEAATGMLVITASQENHDKVAKLIEELDKTERRFEMKTVKLEHAKASDLAMKINTMVANVEPRDRVTGQLPAFISPDDATNTLIVNAISRKMQDVEQLIRIMDVEPTETERSLKPYQIKYADLGSVVAAINAAYRGASKNPREMVDAVAESGTYSVVVMATNENHEKVAKLISDLDQPAMQRQQYPIEVKHGEPEDIAATLTEIYTNTMDRTQRGSRVPAVFTVPKGSRKIIVTTTPSELERVQKLIAELDVSDVAGGRDVRVVGVQHTTAREMGEVLTSYLRPPGRAGQAGQTLLGDVKVLPSPDGNVVVLTGPKDRLDELEELARKVDENARKTTAEAVGRETRVMTLTSADPNAVAGVITQSFSKTGGNVAEADRVNAVAERNTNSVVITASKSNMEKIEKIVNDLDQDSANAPQREIVRLTQAQAADMAEVLNQTYRSSVRSGGTPIVITADSNLNAVVISAGKADIAGVKTLIEMLDKPATDNIEELRVIPLEYIDAAETLEIMQEYLRKPGGTRGRSSSELAGDIRLQASQAMNALLVSGSKEEIDNVEKIVKGMDKEVIGAGTAPKIIPVKHGSASQLASTLTQMFTDPAKQRGSSRRGTAATVDMVPLIMADESTNSLIVRARTVDYNLIADMTSKLDIEPSGPGGMKVVQVSRGIDVRTMAKEIERTVNDGEEIKAKLQPGYRPGRVAIGVDERAPALILAGAPQTFDTVERLVKDLQGLNPGGVRQVPVIIRTGQANPEEIKQMLDKFIESQGIKKTSGR